MFKGILQIKVVNAASRDRDRYYTMLVTLATPPLPGTEVLVSDRTFTVQRYLQRAGLGEAPGGVTVILAQDNTTFKKPKDFERVCKRFEELGFHETNRTACAGAGE